MSSRTPQNERTANNFIESVLSGHEDKVQKELSQIDVEKKDEILENFNRFKHFLAGKVELGENMGLSEEKLTKTTELVANNLSG